MNAAPSQELVRLTAPGGLRMFCLLIAREFMVERRSFGWAASMGFFALMEVVVLGFVSSAVQSGPVKTEMTVGALWLAFLFAGAVGIGRTFSQERDMGALGGVLLLPFDRALLFLAKTFTGLIFFGMALTVMLAASEIVLELDTGGAACVLAPVVALTALGYAAVSTLVAAMTSGLRGRDALLALAVFPIVIPLLYAATSAARAAVDGVTIGAVSDELAMLGAFDAVYLALGLLLFERVIEA